MERFGSRYKVRGFVLILSILFCVTFLFLFASTPARLKLGSNSQPISIISTSSTSSSFDASGAIPVREQMSISHCPAYYEYHADNLAKIEPKYCRNNIVWFECARTYGKEAGLYDFSRYEDEYNNLISRGIEPLGCFIYGWGWWPNNKQVPVEDWPYYYDFVEAFVQHFNETLTYYEMWNEPEGGFWPDSDELFFQFLGNITALVRENDNTAIIACPPVTGPDTEYIDKMIRYFGSDTFDEMFDIFAYHTYCGRAPESLTQRMRDVNKVLEKHDINDPLWITEVGFSTVVDTEEQIETMVPYNWNFQAEQVLKVYNQAFEGNISSMFWYCLNDWCDTDELTGEGRFGLMYCANPDLSTYSFKPAGYTYDTLNTLITNATYYPNGFTTQAPPGGKIWKSYFFTERNTTAIILWSENIGNRCTLTILPPSGSENVDIDYGLKIYNYYENSSRNIQDGKSYQLQLNSTPLLLEVNYTQAFEELSISPAPLTIFIDVDISLPRLLILILAPIPGLLGIIIVVKKRLDNRKEAAI